MTAIKIPVLPGGLLALLLLGVGTPARADFILLQNHWDSETVSAASSSWASPVDPPHQSWCFPFLEVFELEWAAGVSPPPTSSNLDSSGFAVAVPVTSERHALNMLVWLTAEKWRARPTLMAAGVFHPPRAF